ncbi:golgin candidate 1-like isoform X2 [Andrographis paniculata]|uniref:golgin candidate 1-like isoform X2 n=1 Tax=Andrographis paniculata TaxID=175694 RepID=UPI0021E7BF6B|nr:golgin candidate 1-like isoform X2 [Andrographis paniculata]
MAAWLKAAEDLFEVVDRRAKLVAGDTPEELHVPTQGSNGREAQVKRARPRSKSQKKKSSNEDSSAIDIVREETIVERLQPQAESDKNASGITNFTEQNLGTPSGKIYNDEKHKEGRDDALTETSPSGAISNDEDKSVGDHRDTEMSNAEVAASKLNSVHSKEEFADTPVEHLSNSSKDTEVVGSDSLDNSYRNVMSEDAYSVKSIEPSESQILLEEAASKADSLLKDVDSATESHMLNKQHEEQKATAETKVQQQIEEAQGLLKTAQSSGQSKEARLARVCAELSSRLQEYKSENAQLEELLTAERELSKSYEAKMEQLQKDLSASKGEASRVEANMRDALLAKNAEIESLVSSIDALKKQATLSEGNLASLQEDMDSMMRNRELTETRMMQALREELSSAEWRAEDEHSAHNATKLAARDREVELEQRAIEASSALARVQRTADDRASKVSELEQKVALLEADCASLNQELQDMEARIHHEQKKAPDDANQIIQVQSMQEEVERARRGQQEAESKLSSIEAEVQKMRVEMASMKRDAEHYSRQEHMELEKRYRELTDLLYYKQTQLETMASEKAAAEFQLEKEVKRHQEAQFEAERNRASRGASTSWEDDSDMKSLESLPLHHRHMAGARLQLQKAAKLLDTGAVRATKFLWRYPTARIILLFYLVFVHLFLMYLLHHLQDQADAYTSKEVAESMGLNTALP